MVILEVWQRGSWGVEMVHGLSRSKERGWRWDAVV